MASGVCPKRKRTFANNSSSVLEWNMALLAKFRSGDMGPKHMSPWTVFLVCLRFSFCFFRFLLNSSSSSFASISQLRTTYIANLFVARNPWDWRARVKNKPTIERLRRFRVPTSSPWTTNAKVMEQLRTTHGTPNPTKQPSAAPQSSSNTRGNLRELFAWTDLRISSGFEGKKKAHRGWFLVPSNFNVTDWLAKWARGGVSECGSDHMKKKPRRREEWNDCRCPFFNAAHSTAILNFNPIWSSNVRSLQGYRQISTLWLVVWSGWQFLVLSEDILGKRPSRSCSKDPSKFGLALRIGTFSFSNILLNILKKSNVHIKGGKIFFEIMKDE